MTSHNLFLYIILPIAVLLIVALSFIAFKTHNLLWKRSRANELSTLIRKERIEKMDSELNKIMALSAKEPKFVHLANDVEQVYTDMYVLLDSLETVYEELHTNYFWTKTSTFKKMFKDAKIKIEQLDNLEKSLDYKMAQVTNQEEFLRNEFSHHQTRLRKAINVYGNKRILLDKISSNIDKIIQKIDRHSKEFDEAIAKGDMKRCSFILKNYSREIAKLCFIINDGPTIQTYIDTNIPSQINSLTKKYFAVKESLHASNEVINIVENVKHIAIQFQKLKADYRTLQLDEAKENIKKILKSIKSIEKQIDFEIQSRKIFLEMHSKVIAAVKEGLTYYIDVKNHFKDLIGKGRTLDADLIANYEDIDRKTKFLDEKVVAFQQLPNDFTIAYSTKVSRTRMLLQETIALVDELNEIIADLKSINAEIEIARNKYRQVEAAINELATNSAQYHIIFTKEENKMLDEIKTSLSNLASIIAKDVLEPGAKEKIANLILQSISVYRNINSKMLIAEMASNLIKEFSAIRAHDAKTNLAFVHAEKFYIEGNYLESLNYIITHLEGNQK